MNSFRKHKYILLFVSFVGLVTVIKFVYGNAGAAPASKTGAPGENTCTQCHNGTVNSGPGSVSMVFGNNETQYVPGNTYTITVTTSDPNQSRFGFQITALQGGGGPSVGTFAITNTTNTAQQTGSIGGNTRKYISHKNANSNNTWTFDWTAPGTDIGIITFYLVGNAANNNNNSSLDKIYKITMDVSAAAPVAPVAGFSASQTSVCPNGSVTFTDTSANNPASWAWSFPGGSPSTSTSQNPTVTYAASGTYDVTLIATNGIGSDTIVQTAYITVNTPPALTGSATAALCNGGSDGSIDLTVSGNGPFTYNWSNGDQVEDPAGLATGTYDVTVTDGNGCTGTSTFTVTEPDSIALSTSSTNATCGVSDGTATVNASGGTPGYSYSWSNGDTSATATALGAGSYTVTVTDANGCTEVATAAVSNSGAPSASVTGTDVSCFGDTDGSATLTVTGGTSPYTYTWSNGDTTQNLSNVTAGTYTVTVTGADQCVSTQVVTIGSPAALTTTSSSTPEVSGNDGTATTTPAGGNGGYSYSWSNGQTTATATGLAAGTYTVTITDSKGCQLTDTVVVDFMIAISPDIPQDLFAIGPNPFSDYIALKPNKSISGNFSVHIFDLKGRLVFADQLESNGIATNYIRPQYLENGVYFLMINGKKGKLVKKIIKISE